MRYQKLLLPETRQARAWKARVPKLKLGNQRVPFDVENAVPMNNQKMHYFPEQDVIHLAITDEDEIESLELRAVGGNRRFSAVFRRMCSHTAQYASTLLRPYRASKPRTNFLGRLNLKKFS